MANAIIHQISREVFRAFINGKSSVRFAGKEFKMEKVIANHWRMTDEHGADIGLRFDIVEGKCRFFLA